MSECSVFAVARSVLAGVAVVLLGTTGALQSGVQNLIYAPVKSSLHGPALPGCEGLPRAEVM